jgi:periplasmic divalent cation tolerance protein
MQDQPIVVLITVPSPETGEQIARALLEQKLAACANLLPGVKSLYTWQGRLNQDEEALLIVKSKAKLFKEGLVPAVTSLHPYQVPEIIALPVVMGLESYLDWIEEVTAA